MRIATSRSIHADRRVLDSLDEHIAFPGDAQARAVLDRVRGMGKPSAVARSRARPGHHASPVVVRHGDLGNRPIRKPDELDIGAARDRRDGDDEAGDLGPAPGPAKILPR